MQEGRTELPNDRISHKKYLSHCFRGGRFSGVLWSVCEIRVSNKETQEEEHVQRFICCDLLRSVAGEWGHKPMDEAMCPYYYSCPLSYLQLVPPEVYEGTCAEWRKGVRKYHAALAEKRQMRRKISATK